ncbi:a-kinase anchor protein 10, mitochondrial [Trichonephila inaurata madagascariensis]|uniref:A-kinase anchor protein 10, mitochondrial n=1 Tax=Trichonephila inaurata madagascariensis TaxID=2747483 RepID=A0A8X6MAD7_9ARAC|nr:a-kinase anchor protein 10, mitochondrial [Trichonephila inaurata madagascariensis]
MPLFRRRQAPVPRTSSISVYGQGRAQALQKSKHSDKSSLSGSFSSIDLDDRPHPLAFAEATFDPSLPIKTKSRLSKDIEEILHDNAALAYFIQFMDAKKTKHLVKFWLEAESFRISAETKEKNQVKKPEESATCDADLSIIVSSSTGSSEFVSDKSEKVFQSSSHTISSDLNKKNQEREEFSKGVININVPSVNTHDLNCVPPLNNYKNTNELDYPNDNSLKEKLGKTIEQSSSVDSGCEDRSKDSNQSVEFTLEDDFNEDQSTQVTDAHNVKSSIVHKSEVDSIKNGPCDEIQNNKTLTDGLVRLETSTEQDANAIYSKYLAPDASHPIGISNELRLAIKNSIFKPSGDVDSQCFVPAQEFIVKRLDKEYYPLFLRSSFHCKHQIDVLTSGNVFLADVLYNDSALFFFMEFMEQEGVRHLVDFLLTADNFRKQLLAKQGNYDGMQAQADAMVLYDKYFSLQATTPLGFSDSVRFELEANICQETGPEPDCFLKPVKILTQYLEKTFLLQFLSSQLYFKYISECIIIIQNDGADAASHQKSTGSDSGSEQSLPISSINTLLAMDGKQPGASKAKSADSQEMKIDMFQFKPEALWQRPLAGKLQMAHVDHLGRVTTEFEPPDPEKKKGESKISKAMKKLVNWEEDKNQEEMAWKPTIVIMMNCLFNLQYSSSVDFKKFEVFRNMLK